MLSGFSMSQDIPLMRQHNIQAVLSIVVQNEIEQNRYEPPIVGRVYEVEDDDWEDIGTILPAAFDFIDQQLLHTNILVHCIAGVSRSPTVVAYYLMKKNNWNYETAL
jgi:protein-tyrosine phosphatase